MIVIGMVLLVVAVMGVVKCLRSRAAKALREEHAREQQAAEKLQKERFDKAFDALHTAAAGNRMFNVLDGKACPKYGPIRLPIFNEGKSIFVNLDGPTMQGHIPILQFDVWGQKVHYHVGAYGEDVYADGEEEFEQILRAARKIVQDFRLFPERAAA